MVEPSEEDASLPPSMIAPSAPQATTPDVVKEADRGRHWLDFVTAGFAFLAALGSISAAAVGFFQWDVYRRQLAVMLSEQRPWVRADPVIDGDFFYAKGLGATLPFHFDLTNVGHAPAFGVKTRSTLYTPQKANEDIRATWKAVCRSEQDQTGIAKGFGFVLFPGETARSDKDSLGAFTLLTDESIEASMKASGSGGLNLFIFGCVSYLIAGEEKRHTTGFLYSLRAFKVGGLVLAFDPHERFPGKEIHLESSQLSSEMTD